MACPGWRRQGTRHRSRRCGRRWRETLGIRFEGERGERFFRSTLIQTLFYGIFSAWVLWSREEQARDGPQFEAGHGPRKFRWKEAVWHLRAPVLRALFAQLSNPDRLEPLGLVEVLDWTSAALDRVDRAAFFSRFNEGDAVPYFYEPFLEAFDPALRKQLGVWYTPPEVVRYMVARVDKALKDDLGIAEGLAAEQRLCAGPVLRHRGLLGGGAPPHRAECGERGPRGARGRGGEEGRRPSACSGSRSCPRRSSSRTCRSA